MANTSCQTTGLIGTASSHGLDARTPRLLVNHWLVVAPDATILGVRCHFYAAQGPGLQPEAFLRARAPFDWRIARQFGPPELHIDRLALEFKLGAKRTAARYPPGPPLAVHDERFAQDPQLMFGDAMTRLMMDLPDSYFLDDPQAYFYYSSVLLRPPGEGAELSLLDERDERFPGCLARARFTVGA